MANEDDELAMAAGAGVGGAGQGVSLWARHAREDLQGAHILTRPLVRWPPELSEPAAADTPEKGNEPEIVIPDSVLQARKPLRLPEDAICRSPIAGQVIAVLAAVGDHVTRHMPVMVVEAMKMLNDVSPEVDGVLKAVHVAQGDAVKAGQVLFELA